MPLSSVATHSELVEHTSYVTVLSGSILAEGADQFAAANGAVAVSTRPSESIAMHAVRDGQSSAKIPFASVLDEGAHHGEAPAAGSAELSTEPLLSNATRALLDAHARLKIPASFGSTSAAFHAAAPPVGFVDVDGSEVRAANEQPRPA